MLAELMVANAAFKVIKTTLEMGERLERLVQHLENTSVLRKQSKSKSLLVLETYLRLSKQKSSFVSTKKI